MNKIVYEPFKNDFCKNCYYYITLNNSSRVCGLAVHKPVRKIESCKDYISKEYADEIEAKLLKGNNKC